jgi:hypothetical protein
LVSAHVVAAKAELAGNFCVEFPHFLQLALDLISFLLLLLELVLQAVYYDLGRSPRSLAVLTLLVLLFLLSNSLNEVSHLVSVLLLVFLVLVNLRLNNIAINLVELIQFFLSDSALDFVLLILLLEMVLWLSELAAHLTAVVREQVILMHVLLSANMVDSLLSQLLGRGHGLMDTCLPVLSDILIEPLSWLLLLGGAHVGHLLLQEVVLGASVVDS